MAKTETVRVTKAALKRSFEEFKGSIEALLWEGPPRDVMLASDVRGRKMGRPTMMHILSLPSGLYTVTMPLRPWVRR